MNLTNRIAKHYTPAMLYPEKPANRQPMQLFNARTIVCIGVAVFGITMFFLGAAVESKRERVEPVYSWQSFKNLEGRVDVQRERMDRLERMMAQVQAEARK